MKANSSLEERNFLFMYARPNSNIRREVLAKLKRQGIMVCAQYSNIAIEIICNTYMAEQIFELGYFQFYLTGKCNEDDYKFLSPEQIKILKLWNSRFVPHKKVKDLTGTSWNDKNYGEPLPYTAIDPDEFIKKLEEHKIKVKKTKSKKNIQKLSGAKFVKFEEKLRKKYKNPTAAYHLARLALRLEPDYLPVIEALPRFITDWVDFITGNENIKPGGECWKMTGEVAVGVVFVESGQTNGPRFTDDERDEITQKIIDGHHWLKLQHPEHDLFWYYDFQHIQINENDRITTANDAYWILPAIERVRYNGHTYSGDFDGIKKYREDLKNDEKADYGIVIFVTPYVSTWIYADGRKFIVLAKNSGNVPVYGNFLNWNIDSLDLITAHETCHLFGAPDEYTGEGTPCSTCDSLHGCYQIPNGNCNSCAYPKVPCLMGSTSRYLCDYTRAQIGWADIFVETWTPYTDDAKASAMPILDIGTKEYRLSTQSAILAPYVEGYSFHRFGPGFKDGTAIWDKELAYTDIQRIMFKLAFYGGWRIDKYNIIFRGDRICSETIDKLLDVENTRYIGCTFQNNSVNSLIVEIKTGDVWLGGTDDIVNFYVGSRGWTLDVFTRNDFERGNRDAFDLGAPSGLSMNDFTRLAIVKSPDGPFGGWYLEGVKVIANGIVIYDNQNVNQWLEGSNRTWAVNL